MPIITSENNQIFIRSTNRYQPSTLREDDKSVEFTLATDNPVPMFKEGLGYVNETLVADGASFKDSVLLLDSHNRNAVVEKTLGSVRDFRVEGAKLVGRLYFADTEEAKRAYGLIKGGHLTNGSVGYKRTETRWIPQGESYEYEGRSYEGPLLLTTKWDLEEFSLVSIPADKDATVRGINDNGFTVIEKNNIKETVQMPTKTEEQKQVQMEAENKTETVVANNGEALERAKREAVKLEKERINAINEICVRFDCKDIATRAIAEDMSIDQTNKLVLDELSKRSKPLANVRSNITITADEKEKFIDAASDGLLMRSGLEIEKPASGAEDFRGFSLKNIAQAVLRRNGDNRIYSDHEMLEHAMRSGSQSYSDFNHILDNGVKKAVMTGYKQAPATWRLWATKGSVENLEPTKRVNISDIPDLALNPEGAEIEYATIGDKGEQVQVDTYANKLVLTRRAILADDLGLFNRISVRIGYRCAQKIESLAYGVLLSNAKMSDNKALFHADHHNLLSNGVLSKDTLALAYAKMLKQVDDNGSKLSITPRFLVVSPDDGVLAETLTTSTNDVGTLALGNTNYFRNKGLVAIVSPFIAKSDGYFLIGNPSDCDTVEVDFLGGKETPTIEMRDNDKDILSRSWRYYFDIGAKAIDFRGINKTPYGV